MADRLTHALAYATRLHLLVAVCSAMYQAKTSGRNQVRQAALRE